MTSTKSIKGRAFIQLIIIVLTLVCLNIFVINGTVKVSIFLFFIMLPLSFLFTSVRIRSVKKYERESYANRPYDVSQEICIITACKNEGDTIINTVKHYLSFPENVKFVLYDDGSTDGSYKELITISEIYPERFILKPLKRREIHIHPKAFALEDAFETVNCDYFLVIDADSMISRSDFENAVAAIQSRDIDVLHITRRNTAKNNLTYGMSDVEELMFGVFRLLKIQSTIFEGSGFFVKSDLVSNFRFEEDSFSEDNYFYSQMKKKTDKIEFFYTLYSEERAADTLKQFIRQRINWFNMCIPFFMTHEFLNLIFWNILITAIALTVYNPFSMGLVLISIVAGIIFGLVSAVSLFLTPTNIFLTLLYSLCHTLMTQIILMPIFLGIQIKILFGKNRTEIDKNHMGKHSD